MRHCSVRDNGAIRRPAASVILGVSTEGRKEVPGINVGDNESSKYGLSVLNELKNRGVKDSLILCADGLSGIREAIGTDFPETDCWRCIVRQARKTLKDVPDKDKEAFAADLKTICHAADEKKAPETSEHVTEKRIVKCPNSMKRREESRDAVSPVFRFSPDVGRVMYTTSATESLNSAYRKLNRRRSVFPGDTALVKALYPAAFEAAKKRTVPLRNRGPVYGEPSIMYEGRLLGQQKSAGTSRAKDTPDKSGHS